VAGYAFDLRRAFSTFGNPNFLAGLLVLAVPPAAALASRQRSVGASVASWSLAALIVVALLLTFTRGALLGLLAEVVVFAFLLATRRVSLDRTARWGAASVAALLLVAVVASVGRGGEIDLLARISSGGGLTDRLLGWQAALEATLARPLLGWGPDWFLGAFRLHRPDAYAEIGGLAGITGNAHSWPLQLAATVGVPAALAFVLAVGLALVAGARIALGGPVSATSADATASRHADPVYVGLWVGCIGYVVHMLSNVAVHGATTPFWIVLAALTVPGSRLWDPGERRRRVWQATAALLGALWLVAVLASVALVAADAAYLRSRAAYRGDAGGDPAYYAERAVVLNPLSVKYRRGLAEVAADAYYSSLDLTGGPAVSQGDDAALAAAEERFADLLSRHPADYAGHAWHAALLAAAASSGDPEGGGRAATGQAADQAVDAASLAAELDRHAEQVGPILEGETDSEAVLEALSVPGLP
jgi:hypothetical protein